MHDYPGMLSPGSSGIRGLLRFGAVMIAAAALSTQAANILINPGFEADGGHNASSGTAGWSANGNDCWAEINPSVAHSGNNYYKVWGAFNGAPNIQSFWQDKPCLPTAVFKADGWFYTLSTDNVWSGDGANYSWIEVSFRDASENILALYKSDLFTVANYSPDIWYDFQVTNVCQIVAPYAVTGSTNQLVAPPGTTHVRYQHSLYQLLYGGGSTFLDDAVLNQISGPIPPVLNSVYPGNMLQASNYISFNVTSPSATAINNDGIHLTVNGTDVSGSLIITGTAANKHVVYSGLTPNTFAYAATISVTDTVGLSVSSAMNFDTVHPAYVWEAEDYDFTNGLYINNPLLSSTVQPNSYFGVSGVLGVDYYSTATGQAHFRTGDTTGTGPSGDYARQNFLDAQVTDPSVVDYTVGYIAVNDWFNYTRDIPAGTYNIYARLAGGSGATTVSFDDVSGGVTNNLGVFSFSGSDWGAYHYVALTDTNGNLLPFALSGKKTLRATLTSGGDNMNFFMLVPAVSGLPVLSNIAPTNNAVLASVNTFSFTATPAASTTINNSGIHLSLNGVDVSSSLVISGTGAKNVSCPLLRSNSFYTVVIAVTNSTGSGLSRTVQFDTMSPGNFTVQIEDFDYQGGQYDAVNNGLVPNGYLGQNDSILDVDYHHDTSGSYAYRAGLATEIASDVLLPGYTTDYDVGYFNGGDWGNFTRNYPAGKYLVYGRLAGYSMNTKLSLVTGGLGTTNQTLRQLGTWVANPGGWQVWNWVVLQNNGLPAVVTLGGVSTLRVTSSGNCNANYFMLVPIKGISLSASKAGNNVGISFPTVVGSSYSVYVTTSLGTGTWTLLANITGDGTVKSVSDPVTSGARFYKVTSP